MWTYRLMTAAGVAATSVAAEATALLNEGEAATGVAAEATALANEDKEVDEPPSN